MPETQLAIGKDYTELAYMVANLMNFGYEIDGDSYTTKDGYICQPMVLKNDLYENL